MAQAIRLDENSRITNVIGCNVTSTAEGVRQGVYVATAPLHSGDPAIQAGISSNQQSVNSGNPVIFAPAGALQAGIPKIGQIKNSTVSHSVFVPAGALPTERATGILNANFENFKIFKIPSTNTGDPASAPAGAFQADQAGNFKTKLIYPRGKYFLEDTSISSKIVYTYKMEAGEIILFSSCKLEFIYSRGKYFLENSSILFMVHQLAYIIAAAISTNPTNYTLISKLWFI